MTRILHINSDHELLFKVLSHLVDNAVKFTREGTVCVGFEVKGNELEFFVKDTGIGINRDLQATIFDKFTQENISDTRGHEGSGLGLSISKGFVELLGGCIWIESSKGEGSAFFFTLPNDLTAN
jgi:signal transduction histidine kinase